MVTLERPGLRPLREWGFAADDYPTSPVFVPRPDGEPGGHDGWVLVPVLHDDGFRIDVLDAATSAPARSPCSRRRAGPPCRS